MLSGAYAIFCFQFIAYNCTPLNYPDWVGDIFKLKFIELSPEALVALYYTILLLLIGIIVNHLNAYATRDRKSKLYKVYKFLSSNIYMPSRKILQNSKSFLYLREPLERLSLRYFNDTIWGNNKGDDVCSRLFDKAYYKLCSDNDTNNSTIFFRQGIYFFLRNIFLITLIASISTIFLMITDSMPFKKGIIITMLFSLANYLIVIPLAKTYRRMMIKALFANFVEKETDKN